jgi:hypothetical protein
MFSRSFADSATSGRTDGDDVIDRGGVESDCRLLRRGVDAADDFRDRLRVVFLVAGIFALGRESEKVVFAALHPGGVEPRHELFARGAGIGGRLEDDELARAQMACDLVGGAADVREIGLAVCAEGRRDGDDDGVAGGETGEVGGRAHRFGGEGLRDAIGADVLDVGLAGFECIDFLRVDVEAGHRKAALAEEKRERETDVAETDHADDGRAGGDAVEEGGEGGGWFVS